MTALKASGVSLLQLLPPVLLLSVFGFVTTTAMAVYLMPEGNRAFQDLVSRLSRQKGYVGITPRIFVDDFAGMVLYVNSVDTSGKMLENIFIADTRDPDLSHTIIAAKGIVMETPERQGFAMRLYDGEVHYDSKNLKSSDTVQFKTYELALDIPQLVDENRSGKLGESEMPITQLMNKIKTTDPKNQRYNMLVIELHEKFALPFSCILLGFIGMALAVQSRAHGYSAGVAMSLGIFLFYYILLSAAKSLGESGIVPPALGMWMPNLLLGTLAVGMFVQACREAPTKTLLLLYTVMDKIRTIVQGWTKQVNP
jgi:lipopolysaccharide export system permease protein